MVFEIILMAIASFLFSELVGFSIHRLAHHRWSGKLFRDHLRHHSVAYPPTKYLSEKYLGDLRTSFVPYFVPIFIGFNMLVAAVFSWPLFLVFLVISSAVSLANNIFHDSFHVENHWLTRYAWHRRLREVHRIHHENVRKNLGIYWYGYDRLAGSYSSLGKKTRP